MDEDQILEKLYPDTPVAMIYYLETGGCTEFNVSEVTEEKSLFHMVTKFVDDMALSINFTESYTNGTEYSTYWVHAYAECEGRLAIYLKVKKGVEVNDLDKLE
jgi:hypothetical protein